MRLQPVVLNIILKTIIAHSLFFVFVTTSIADDLQMRKAALAMELEDYAVAIQIYKELTDQNEPEAQVKLANLYEQGKGTAKNYITAFNLYRKAAKSGNANGQNALGVIYEKGRGTRRNYTQ